jgi:hypothetical protein
VDFGVGASQLARGQIMARRVWGILLFAGLLCLAALLMPVGRVLAGSVALPSSHKLDENYVAKLCVVTANIAWDKGVDWKYKNDFFLKYLFKIKPAYQEGPVIKYVDFRGFNVVSFVMERGFCEGKRYEYVREIFNKTQVNKEHPARIRQLKAAEEDVNRMDVRGVSGNRFYVDYVRALSPEVIKKCLYVADAEDVPLNGATDEGPYPDDNLVYFIEMRRIFSQYALPFLDVSAATETVKSQDGGSDTRFYVFFLLSGRCEHGMESINNLLYWTSKLTRGKLKHTKLRFINDPDPKTYLESLPHLVPEAR